MDSGALDTDSNPIPKLNNRTINKQETKRQLIIGTWNVRRGLVRRENEINDILKTHDVDIFFLTESDTKYAKSFNLSGYTTVTQMSGCELGTVRIIALVKNNIGANIVERKDLMSETFPSIWLEIQDKHKSRTLVGGFYRQWSYDGKLSVPEQVSEIEEFCRQISLANNSSNKIIILGDANLCSEKWTELNYVRKSVAKPLIQCLDQNGLRVQNVGPTFQADHIQSNGKVAESSIDHVYNSLPLDDCIKLNKLSNSSSDHLPVLLSYSLDLTKLRYSHSVTKRSFKYFTKEKWNEALAKQDWLDVEEATNVTRMVDIFNANVLSALDEIAPIKTFKIRSNHRFGLSESTRELMKKRDKTRNEIRTAATKEAAILIKQYKILRNRVTSQIRKENIEFNNKRILEANSERELWNVTNEVLNPKAKTEWTILNGDGTPIKGELEIAESFNEFFIKKVEELKKGIDPTKIEDPLKRLKEKLKNNDLSLEFKTVTQKQLSVHLKKLNKKKSSGLDGLSQENLILGAENLIAPMTAIVNSSILEGVFPPQWKEAAVTPVLKKGSPQVLGNYRPVSCLPAASKLLEIVVCDQLSNYLESNGLLPGNQHGFRPRRSTMTAWQEVQLDWATKGEDGLVTGVLLWDLSAAFDTLDCEGACEKLKIYGLKERSIQWIRSFLTQRSQRVKIGNAISSSRSVSTGVPQGGVLSPLVFVLFVADLEEWLEHSSAPTYADDTTTGTHGWSVQETLKLMEIDAENVLRFMASNGLVANSNKTAFLLLNSKNTDYELKVKIGTDQVKRESSALLLGIKFQDDLTWKCQVHGKGGVISSLNSRLYIVRRLMSYLSLESVKRVVDGLFNSKVRYGLQLLGRVRLTNDDQECADIKAIQLIQNKLLRTLNKTKIKDKISTRSLLSKFGFLSVNQTNCQIKLMEVWKSLNVHGYPLKIALQSIPDVGTSTRAAVMGKPINIGKSTTTRNSCVSDSIRIWNLAPKSVTESSTTYNAKKAIKEFAKTIPI